MSAPLKKTALATGNEPKQPSPNGATESRKDLLRTVGGSSFDDWNDILANQVMTALWVKNSDAETRGKQVNAALGALMGIAPKDELEGMMAAQLVATHNAAMETYRRAMIPDFEGWRETLNQANKLSRTWTTLLDALNKHRGKGQQKVTVEHVHVHSGGQAVVGMVTPGVANKTRKKELPDAKQVAYAPESPLRSTSQDQERLAMPITRDEQRPMPNARRAIDGGTEG